MCSTKTKIDKNASEDRLMNNTIGMNRNHGCERSCEKKAPAWLVLIAQFILWLTSEETLRTVRVSGALLTIVIVAAFAAGIGSGSVPFIYGAIIIGAFCTLALMLTRGLD